MIIQRIEKALSGKPKKYKITFNKEGCIGAFSCVAVDAEKWLPDYGQAKVDLKDATWNETDQVWELIVEEGQFNPDAETVCPVAVIKITQIEED